jgi:dCTP diphosphatase
MNSVDDLRNALRAFAAERDWDQFHSPKNLAMALAVEVGELMEPLQWLSESASTELSEAARVQLREEIADVFIYLVRLADKLEIDLLEAAGTKLRSNAHKYPVDKAKGNARKYTDFADEDDTES